MPEGEYRWSSLWWLLHFFSHCFPAIPWSAVMVDKSDSIGFYWQRLSTPRSTGLHLPRDHYLIGLAKISSWQCSGLKGSQVSLMSVLIWSLQVQVLSFLPLSFLSTDIFPVTFVCYGFWRVPKFYTPMAKQRSLSRHVFPGGRMHQRVKWRARSKFNTGGRFPSLCDSGSTQGSL